MYQFIFFIHILTAICIIGLVLVQQGKGATIGAAFGSGASQTVFGSRGSGSFLLKVTVGFVIIFFATSITLNRMAVNAVKQATAIHLPVPEQPSAPAETQNIPNIPLPTSAAPVSLPPMPK